MRLIIITLLLSGLTACATDKHHADTGILDRQAAKIQSTVIVNAVPDTQLKAEIIHSNTAMTSGAFMFGAIGGAIAGAVDAAIDAKHQKEADAVAAPLRAVLSDYHFTQEMHQALALSLKPAAILKTAEIIDSDQHLKKMELKTKLQDKPANASLYVESSYALSPDFKQLHIVSKARLYLQGYDLKQLFKYESDFKSEALSGEDPDALQQQWTAKHGALLKAKLRKGIQTVVQQLQQELGGNRKVTASSDPNRTASTVAM